MKITEICIVKKVCNFNAKYQSVTRQVNQLDAYDEFANKDPSFLAPGAGTRTGYFIEIKTDEGITGHYGTVESRSELLSVMDGIKDYLLGKDPMENRLLWDMMSRFDRHARSGVMMMAISALDVALWDLKGKILGQPVYKILGGGRAKLRPYASMLGFSVEPLDAIKKALEIKDMGIRAQKWFFRYGPNQGAEGIRKNLDLAFALRGALGDDYELMFDCYMGWTVNYARRVFNELEVIKPVWVEEVLRPHMMDGYRHLRDSTGIPLSAGEHLYTRMEVNAYLNENIFAVMQSDPVWCGGITEALRIGDLCEMYGVTFAPHGHALMPALHVVASMPPDVSPYCEYLLIHMNNKNCFFKEPQIDNEGFISLNNDPGIGEDVDEERLVSSEIINKFEFN